MSKICVKCGNVIPDGVDVCPTCGREEYDDSNLQNVLNELGLSLDEDYEQSAAEHTPSDEGEPTIRLPIVDEEVDKAMDLSDLSDEPSEEEVDSLPEEDASEETEEAPEAENAIEAILGDAMETIRSPEKEKKLKSDAGKRNGKQRANKADKPRAFADKQAEEEPQKNSATVIGVVIGLIIALLVIGCGVLFMLFRMGFFTNMSDDDLLQTPTEQTGDISPTLAPEMPSQEPQPPVISSDFENESSAMESSAVEANIAAPAPADGETIECTKFTITGTEYLILYSRGVTTEISYVIEPSELRDKITWKSSDETIATVDAFGTIRARRGGTCTITGTCGDKSIKAYVTNEFTVPTTTLDMNMEDITMTYEGQTAELAIDYELTDEQIKATVWESSDPEVAMVDEKGVVTAISNGTAVITASIADYTASCIVRCVDVTGNRGYNSSESEFVINYEDVTLTRKGEYFQLTLKSILGADVPEFTWTSDDTDVATVDSKGIVTAVADGTAYISTNIGQDKFRCVVRVRITN